MIGVFGWPLALADMMLDSLPDQRVATGLATAQWSDLQRAFFGDALSAASHSVEGDTVPLRATLPNGLSRTAQLFVPENLPHGAPLVVMLHGCMQDPDSLARLTGMNRLAQTSGFAVIYPDQETSASAVQCWQWYSPDHQTRTGGEPEVLAELIAQSWQRTGASAANTHVAGISAGGALTALMIHLYPELFASAAIVAGPVPLAAQNMDEALAQMAHGASPREADAANARAAQETADSPARGRRLPVLIVHGADDKIVAASHARQQVEAAIQLNDQLDDGAVNASLSAAAEKKRGDFGEVSIWRDGGGLPLAILLMPRHLGHAWSGGKADEPFAQAGFDLSQLTIDFFMASEREDWEAFSLEKLVALLRGPA